MKNAFKVFFNFILALILIAVIGIGAVFIFSPSSIPTKYIPDFLKPKNQYTKYITQKRITTSQEAISTIKQFFPELKEINEKEQQSNGAYTITKANENNKGWRVLFSSGFGDCINGCADAHYWYFNISADGTISQLGEFSYLYNTQTNGFLVNGKQLNYFLEDCPINRYVDCSKSKASDTDVTCQPERLEWLRLSCEGFMINE